MKKLSFAIILIFAFLISGNVYSQYNDISDSLITGKTYKFVLYNDTEIYGKVLYANSNAKVKKIKLIMMKHR